jgi:hypothetical protein
MAVSASKPENMQPSVVMRSNELGKLPLHIVVPITEWREILPPIPGF